MKKNAWVQYWERVDENFIWGGFAESDPFIIKCIYFITFVGLLVLLEVLLETSEFKVRIFGVGIFDVFNFMWDFLESNLGGFGRFLWGIGALFVFGGTLYSLYFLYALIKSFFK